LIIGSERWRRRAAFASPFYPDVQAYAAALKKAAQVLVQRGIPLRLCPYDAPSDFTDWLLNRLEFFAFALAKLERKDPLAHAAIVRYELHETGRWPRNGQWCAPLGCSMEDARKAAWRGWCRMAAWVSSDGTPQER
jgi:hypothetical protein